MENPRCSEVPGIRMLNLLYLYYKSRCLGLKFDFRYSIERFPVLRGLVFGSSTVPIVITVLIRTVCTMFLNSQVLSVLVMNIRVNFVPNTYIIIRYIQ